MAIYYISPEGDDGTGDGSYNNPWETLQKLIDECQSAGDTGYLLSGSYTGEADADWNSHSGSSGSEITFAAYSGEGTVTVTFTTATQTKMDINNVDYITLQDIRFDGNDVDTNLCRVRGSSSYIVLDNCTFRDIHGHAVVMNNCDHVTVSDCTVSQNSADSQADDGINLANASDVTLSNCYVEKTDHSGIHLETSNVHDVDVVGCEVTLCGSHGISLLTGPYNITIEYCIIHGDAAGYDDETYGMAGGIRIDDAGATITIQKNVVYYTGMWGIQLEDSITGPVNVYNNTFYDTAKDASVAANSAVNFDTVTGSPTVNFKNNIIVHFNSTGRILNIDSSTTEANFDFDYNCWRVENSGNDDMRRNSTTYTSFSNYQGGGYESNSIDSDPLFINVSTDDYRLTSSSPCIDAGVDVGLGYLGSAPDIGAYEVLPIEPSAASAVGAVVDPTVELGAIAVTPAAVASIGTTVAPSVELGAVSITPSAISAVGAVVAPTVVLGSVSVSPDAVSAVGGVVAPSIELGSISVTPTAVSAVGAAVDPIVELGAISVTPSAISAVGAVVAPTVVLGSVSISPTQASAVGATVDPTVGLGSITVTPTPAYAVGAVVAPTVGLGSISVAPTPAAAIGAVSGPTVVLGSVSVTPAAVFAVAATVTPSVVLGGVSVTPTAVAAIGAVSGPTVVAGSVVVAPDSSDAIGSVVAPTVIAPVSVVPSPAEAIGAAVPPAVITGSVIIAPAPVYAVGASVAPLVVYGAVSIAPGAAAAVASVHGPDVWLIRAGIILPARYASNGEVVPARYADGAIVSARY